MESIWEDRLVPTYCYMCVNGPDLFKVHVVNGVAVGIEPNYDFAQIHPAEAKVCVKVYGLIQKHYNPDRIKGPMKRTNPKKGIGEDPKWVEITWDEALDLVAEKLLAVKEKGQVDENGYRRIVFTEGNAGICIGYHGTLPVVFGGRTEMFGAPAGLLLTDYTLSHGGGVKCHRTEHLLGELWHKAFICATDTPLCRYEVGFGKNDEATGGVTSARRHAEARVRGIKRVQVEPHLSVTGATADEWIPIKPETDNAFLYAMIHVLLHEMDRGKACDIEFLKQSTNSPYLVAPNGYFLRDEAAKKPLIWDAVDNRAQVFDAEDIRDFALEGEHVASGVTIGPDGETETMKDTKVKPALQLLIEHVKDYTPEWAAQICDVPAETIRRVTRAFAENAMIGATIKIDGVEMPYRPVSVGLGKTTNNGWGAVQCVWAKHVLQILVGALEVPGGEVGSSVLGFSTPPMKTPDGFLEYRFIPSDKERWKFPPGRRDGALSLCPLCGSYSGPLNLAWKWTEEPSENWPQPSVPAVLVTFRVNPMISQFDTPLVTRILEKIPFHIAFVYTMDETAWFADVLLPEDSELESLHLFPAGGAGAGGAMEAFWEHIGVAIRQPAVKRAGNTKDVTDIATELAKRLGMLADYNEGLNQGAFLGIRLKDTPYELSPEQEYTADELMDRFCKARTKFLSQGKAELGLEWFKQNGAFLRPWPKVEKGLTDGRAWWRPWYLYPLMKEMGIRFELPYQERLKRYGTEVKKRLHEKGINWWDPQLDELQALPKWEDISQHLDEVTIRRFGKDPKDYPFWLLATRSMQYSWATNIGVPHMHEAASRVLGHTWIQMNRGAAEKLGIKDGDEICIESPYGRMKGRVKLREGIRPEVILTTAMYGQWAQPFAKELGIPNLNSVAPALVELTSQDGGSKDHVKVKIYKGEPEK